MDLEPKNEEQGAETPILNEDVVKPEVDEIKELVEQPEPGKTPEVLTTPQPVDDFKVHDPQTQRTDILIRIT